MPLPYLTSTLFTSAQYSPRKMLCAVISRYFYLNTMNHMEIKLTFDKTIRQ